MSDTGVVTIANGGIDAARPVLARLRAEVRRRRDAAGLSQADLAALVNYIKAHVSMVERSRSPLPSYGIIAAIDEALSAGGALMALRAEARAELLALRNVGQTRRARVSRTAGHPARTERVACPTCGHLLPPELGRVGA